MEDEEGAITMARWWWMVLVVLMIAEAQNITIRTARTGPAPATYEEHRDAVRRMLGGGA